MATLNIDDNQMETIYDMSDAFPYTLHVQDFTHFSVPWHWHEEVELVYVQSGALKVMTVNKEYTIHEGQAFFMNTGVLTSKQDAAAPGQRTVEYAHLFHPMLIAGHFHSVFENKYIKPILRNRYLEILVITKETPSGKKLIDLLHQITTLNREANAEFLIRNALSLAWMALLEEIRLQSANAPKNIDAVQQRIHYMIGYIQQHYNEKIMLADVAAFASISEREALRCFKNQLGQSPMDYLLEYRLIMARKLLKETSLPITDIAMQTGFSESGYFSRQFKKKYEITPKEYQKAHHTKI